MRYEAVGRSGLIVSKVGLGCRRLGADVDQSRADRLIRVALDCGITLFDTADTYNEGRSELTLGHALEGRRDEAVVATKLRWPTGPSHNDRGASHIHIRRAVEESLRRLATDRIDLLQIHAPDPVTPIEETLAALDALAISGKVLYAGTTNFRGWQLVDADWSARTAHYRRFVSTQAPYSLLDPSAELDVLPAARHVGVGFLACLVLGRGVLVDHASPPSEMDWRRRAFAAGDGSRRVETIRSHSSSIGVSSAELGIAAVLAQPGVCSAIVGATEEEHLTLNARAANLRLSEEQLRALRTALHGAPGASVA